ncbi:MAG: type II secretion system F family protein [Clostridiales Family XIII bacterium]|jgi:tight adherence protein B|nr:type II secretion system F family protein [Clostridiales Family XIII bacterium]
MPDYGKYALSRKELLAYFAAFALGALAVGGVFYGSPLAAIALLPLCLPGMKFYERRLAAKRRNALALSFRDMLYSLSSSFSTGRQMPEALSEALDAMLLIYPQDAPLVRELEDMKRRLLANREGEAAVLGDFAARSHNEDIRNFVGAYLICRTTGGDIENLIVKAAEVIIEKMGIQREIRLITAQKRLESKILLIIPVGILFFLQMFSPGYTEPLYATLAGRLIMTAALALTGAAYLWGAKLTEIDI